jgi:hypothetical protein
LCGPGQVFRGEKIRDGRANRRLDVPVAFSASRISLKILTQTTGDVAISVSQVNGRPASRSECAPIRVAAIAVPASIAAFSV